MPTESDVRPSPTPPSVIVDCSVTPQHPRCRSVIVTQGYVDDSTRVFTEVIALRSVVQEFLVERAANSAERAGARAMIKALDEAIAIRDKIDAANLKLAAVYQQIIEAQDQLITKLTRQLNKPKSFFEKVLQKLKDISLLAIGVAVGRGF